MHKPYITHEDYTELGYAAVPKPQFPRYEARAELTVRKYTFDRVTDMAGESRLAEMNRRGMCELVELYYLADNPRSTEAQARQVITGFRNKDYSETYLGSDRGDQQTAAPAQLTVADIIATYFTPEQRYRGVG